MKFAAWIREWAEKGNVEFARDRIAAKLGVSTATIQSWCTGKRIPDSRNIRAIMALTDGRVTANDFIEPVDSKPKEPTAAAG